MKEKPVPKFKAGDVVSLRSGGEKMTIEVVLPYHKVHPAIGYICVWMRDGDLIREEISEAALCIIGRGRYGGWFSLSERMDLLFWWAADAASQPETQGCLRQFALMMFIVAIAFLIGTLIWG